MVEVEDMSFSSFSGKDISLSISEIIKGTLDCAFLIGVDICIVSSNISFSGFGSSFGTAVSFGSGFGSGLDSTDCALFCSTYFPK